MSNFGQTDRSLWLFICVNELLYTLGYTRFACMSIWGGKKRLIAQTVGHGFLNSEFWQWGVFKVRFLCRSGVAENSFNGLMDCETSNTETSKCYQIFCFSLTFTNHCPLSADDKLVIFFLYIPSANCVCWVRNGGGVYTGFTLSVRMCIRPLRFVFCFLSC